MKYSHTVLAGLAVAAALTVIDVNAQNGGSANMKNTDGLIAHYPLDGNANDLTDGKYHGELTGTTPVADRHGNKAGALHFDGIDDVVTIPHPPPLKKTGTTIALWVKFESGGENTEWEDVFDGKGFSQPILSQDDGDGIRVFMLGLWKGMIRSNGQGSGHSLIPDSKVRVEMDRWYHVAMVRGAKHRLFVDGEQVQEKDDVFNVCACQPWLLGATGAWGRQNPRLHGAVDDVKVYGRALSAAEILDLSKETNDSAE